VAAPAPQEYLVSFGSAGDFGRFQAVAPLACGRGDRVVVSGRRGLELGEVLCEATPRHARVLQSTPVGQLLRLATPEDEQDAGRMRQRGQALFDDSRLLARDLGLPLEMIDVEISLDGRQGVIQFLGEPDADLDSFAAALAGRHDLFILMHNLAGPAEEEHGGCGEPNCGRAAGGSCTNCGSGGGCATGCGAGSADMRDYFAHLRAQMDQRKFTPLL
jgi:cell fate regulator YaaT (PSP1 superfamily)